MGMSAGPQHGHKSDINITPLVDVCLVLLIIFMVITPMLQKGKDVKLPQVAKSAKKKHAHNSKNPDPLIVSITADKKIWIKKKSFTRDELKAKIMTELSVDSARKILLKGDQSLTFGTVRKVLLVAQHAHAKGVGLGVQEVSKAGGASK